MIDLKGFNTRDDHKQNGAFQFLFENVRAWVHGDSVGGAIRHQTADCGKSWAANVVREKGGAHANQRPIMSAVKRTGLSSFMQQTATLIVPPPATMKTHLLISILAAAFGLSACSTSTISRIDQDRARYESWPLEVKEGILAGEARKGMTPEQVEMALGKPTQIVSRSARAGDDEVWVYRKSTVGSGILRNTGVSIGGGVGGVNVGTGLGGGGRGQTPEESEVVFANGVVVRSDAKR